MGEEGKGSKGDEKEKKVPTEAEKKNGGGGGDKKDGGDGDGPITVVMKLDLHCEGCAFKVKRFAKGLDGVDVVERRAKFLPEIAPVVEGGTEDPSTLQGCIQRIRKTIGKMKRVESISVDVGKDLVTVKGTMDVKALPAVLKEKLKRSVEVVPAKDGGGGDEGGGCEKKAAGGGGGGDKKGGRGGDGGEKKDGGGGGDGGEKKKDGGGGGEKKKEGGGGSGGSEKNKEGGSGGDGGGGEKKEGGGGDGKDAAAEAKRMEYYGPYEKMVHAPQMFSDENPNACSVM